MYYCAVSRNIKFWIALVATFLMAVSPLYEFFDKWDNVAATGNDTAVTVVAIAACIGLCFCMATVMVGLIGFVFSFLMRLLSGELAVDSQSDPHALEYQQILFSPPLSLTSLRI